MESEKGLGSERSILFFLSLFPAAFWTHFNSTVISTGGGVRDGARAAQSRGERRRAEANSYLYFLFEPLNFLTGYFLRFSRIFFLNAALRSTP